MTISCRLVREEGSRRFICARGHCSIGGECRGRLLSFGPVGRMGEAISARRRKRGS